MNDLTPPSGVNGTTALELDVDAVRAKVLVAVAIPEEYQMTVVCAQAKKLGRLRPVTRVTAREAAGGDRSNKEIVDPVDRREPGESLPSGLTRTLI